MSDPDALILPWYALKVRSRREEPISGLLRNKGYEIFHPTYVDRRQYSDRIKKVDAPLFPGYVFCRLDVMKRLPVLQTPGVEYVVSRGSEPEPVPESELLAIRTALESGLQTQQWPYLKAGDRVRVRFGAMTGVEGILVSTKGAEKLILSVHLLQRSIAVEIDRSWIEPLDVSRGLAG